MTDFFLHKNDIRTIDESCQDNRSIQILTENQIIHFKGVTWMVKKMTNSGRWVLSPTTDKTICCGK